MSTFFTELRRRNVVRVGLAYAFTGWILVEVADVVMPTFGAPDWVQKVLTFLIILGLPIALIFAWAFELTPEGLKRERDVDRSQSITRQTGRRLDFIIIGLLVVALGISVYLNVFGPDGGDAGDGIVSSSRPAIAVLPFTSRSADPENVFFADGIHDDLLTMLANIGSIKVISRTSVMEYRDTQKNMREIGNELGVRTVLEGAVQKSGNNVRINVQLIDTDSDEHLWAKTYDRELNTNNIFAIQSEISTAIAGALEATLTPAEQKRLETVPTENLEAYNLYLAGKNNLHQRRLENLHQARQQFEKAIQLDPGYAKAYSGLSDAVMLILNNHQAISTDEAFGIAEKALARALELDSNDADIHASLGLSKMNKWEMLRTQPDYDDAAVAFRRAIDLNPNHVQALMWQANLYDDIDVEKSIGLLQRATELDPLARIPQLNLGVQYARLGDNDAALRQWLKTIDLHPDWPTPYSNVAGHLAGLGRLDESYAWLIKADELSTDPLAGLSRVFIYVEFGQLEAINELVQKVPPDHPFSAIIKAYGMRFNGDHAGALRVMDELLSQMERPPIFFLDFHADTLFLAGRYEEALEQYKRARPKLFQDALEVDIDNVGNALAVAKSMQQVGNNRGATRLVEKALQSLEGHPRIGLTGYGIRDAQCLALLDRHDEAVAALRTAFDAGWRSSYRYQNWSLEDDPFLASVRETPEFRAVLADLNTDLSVMKERAKRAEADNNLDELRDAARLRLASQ